MPDIVRTPILERFLGTGTEGKRQIDALINEIATSIVGRCLSHQTIDRLGDQVEKLRFSVATQIRPDLAESFQRAKLSKNNLFFQETLDLMMMSGFMQSLHVSDAAKELGISLQPKDTALDYNDYLYLMAERFPDTGRTVFHMLKADDFPNPATRFDATTFLGALVGMRIVSKMVYHVKTFALDNESGFRTCPCGGITYSDTSETVQVTELDLPGYIHECGFHNFNFAQERDLHSYLQKCLATSPAIVHEKVSPEVRTDQAPQMPEAESERVVQQNLGVSLTSDDLQQFVRDVESGREPQTYGRVVNDFGGSGRTEIHDVHVVGIDLSVHPKSEKRAKTE
jgi:hypothetical protein